MVFRYVLHDLTLQHQGCVPTLGHAYSIFVSKCMGTGPAHIWYPNCKVHTVGGGGGVRQFCTAKRARFLAKHIKFL